MQRHQRAEVRIAAQNLQRLGIPGKVSHLNGAKQKTNVGIGNRVTFAAKVQSALVLKSVDE